MVCAVCLLPAASVRAQTSGTIAAWDRYVADTEVELTLSTRDEEHCAALLVALSEQGYEVERLR